jgi:hypothetical protein
VSCAGTGTTEVVLSPVERSGGMKMVVIPTTLTSALVVESRRAEGYDTNGFKGGAPLRPGQSISSGGVTITVLSQDATGDRVRSVR